MFPGIIIIFMFITVSYLMYTIYVSIAHIVTWDFLLSSAFLFC